MAVLEAEVAPKILTYDDYMAEGEINRRYEIINGVRIYMTQPTDWHQDIAGALYEMFRAYQRRTRTGRAKFAPCDVLISSNPLKTRQPDVLFISHERYHGRAPQDAYPYSPAPELVVEVLSPSETHGIQIGKISDYCTVDVKECWLVSSEAQTIEILRLTSDGPQRAAIYGAGQSAQSLTFPDLRLALDDIFRIEE